MKGLAVHVLQTKDSDRLRILLQKNRQDLPQSTDFGTADRHFSASDGSLQRTGQYKQQATGVHRQRSSSQNITGREQDTRIQEGTTCLADLAVSRAPQSVRGRRRLKRSPDWFDIISNPLL